MKRSTAGAKMGNVLLEVLECTNWMGCELRAATGIFILFHMGRKMSYGVLVTLHSRIRILHKINDPDYPAGGVIEYFTN